MRKQPSSLQQSILVVLPPRPFGDRPGPIEVIPTRMIMERLGIQTSRMPTAPPYLVCSLGWYRVDSCCGGMLKSIARGAPIFGP